MDSGWSVPTLNPGFNDTAALKLLMVARALWPAGRAAEAEAAAGWTASGAGFMLWFKARFLAVERAGKSSAANTAMMATTIMSSINVKARRGIFIGVCSS